MNKWPICKIHGKHFPPSTIEERDSQICRTCKREEELRVAQEKAEYMQSPRFE